MQNAHRYPSHRMPGPPILWRARFDADINAPPLPKRPQALERTLRIRTLFLTDFAGCCTALELGDRCDDLGLFSGLTTHRSCHETLMAALRPIATHNVWESVYRPTYDRPGTAPR